MSDFSMDLTNLHEVVNPSRTRYSFSQYGHLFRKVAFDMYKPISSGTNQLWELRDEDGGQFLYAVYEEPEDLIANSEQSKQWQAEADSEGNNVTLSYQNVPIYRFSSKTYSFKSDKANEFAYFIEKKAMDPKWISELLEKAPDMTTERREAVRKLLDGDD